MDEIIQFINRFTDSGKRTEVIDCFANGCCYWFAHILNKRFEPSNIVHDPIVGHFACYIDGKIYDITGNITDQGRDWDLWDAFMIVEPKVARHIYESCALFIKEE